MSRLVVFGTGQIGRPLIEQLAGQGHHVIAVNRRGGAIPEVDLVAGDATEPHGQRPVESMAANPTSAKSATRAAMTSGRLTAHRTGQVEVAIGRASGYRRRRRPGHVGHCTRGDRAAFGVRVTPLDEALTATLAWYRDRALVSTH